MAKKKIKKAQMGMNTSLMGGDAFMGLIDVIGRGMSWPQRKMTEAITSGKYSEPSKAIGIQNPVGAFATDAVLDPTNLIGAGVATKVFKTGAKAVAKETVKDVAKGIAKAPWRFKPDPNMGYRMLGKDGFKDALETGVLRAKPVPGSKTEGAISLSRNMNRNPNTGRLQSALDRPYFADGFVDSRYGSEYMAAVNKAENNLVNIPTHKGIATPDAGEIPIDKATFYKKDWLRGYKEVPKKKKGGVIEDDRGQWAHPGEITKIGSNQITMKGVPYPVLGVSDKGHKQMMYPGQDYSFDGKSVTEYPMMQSGGWLDGYDQYKAKYNLVETPDYNLKRAYELGYTPDKDGHLPSVDSETLQFLKTRNHPTVQKEIDWFNSKKGKKFRKEYEIDSTDATYYKYIPKKQNGGWLDKYNQK